MTAPIASQDTGSDFTELFRRHAFWLGPSMLLFHALFLYGLAPQLVRANLVAVPVTFLGGFALLRFRRATTILAAAIGLFTFGLVYTPGVVAPMSYLALVKHPEWMPPVLVLSLIGLGGFCASRVRASLRIEWAQPLDKTPGVHLSVEHGTLRRELTPWDQSGLAAVSYILLPVAGLSMYLTRGTPVYLTCVLFIFPYFIAFLCSVALARWVAFYIAVRRWEVEHRSRLFLSALSRRRRKPQSKPRPTPKKPR
jgi:hypothetical protein